MKNRYFSKMTHFGRPRQEVTGFSGLSFLYPTVFLLFTNDCWLTSESSKKKKYTDIFLLKFYRERNFVQETVF